MKEVVTTSLKLNPQTYKKFRIRCIEKNIEFSQGMDLALKEWLKIE